MPTLRGLSHFIFALVLATRAQSTLGPKADESETRQGLSLISWGELVSFCC